MLLSCVLFTAAIVCNPGQCAENNECFQCNPGTFAEESNTACLSNLQGECAECPVGFACTGAYNVGVSVPADCSQYAQHGNAVNLVCPAGTICPGGYYCGNSPTTAPQLCTGGAMCNPNSQINSGVCSGVNEIIHSTVSGAMYLQCSLCTAESGVWINGGPGRREHTCDGSECVRGHCLSLRYTSPVVVTAGCKACNGGTGTNVGAAAAAYGGTNPVTAYGSDYYCGVGADSAGQTFADVGKCSQCPSGQISPAGFGSCSQCPLNHIADAAQITCTACAAGKESNDQVTCTDCVGSTTSVSGGSCEACVVGSTFIDSVTPCQCNIGRYQDGNSICQLCPAGFFKGSVGNEACEACPINTYGNAQSLTGSTGCISCPNGETTATNATATSAGCSAPVTTTAEPGATTTGAATTTAGAAATTTEAAATTTEAVATTTVAVATTTEAVATTTEPAVTTTAGAATTTEPIATSEPILTSDPAATTTEPIATSEPILTSEPIPTSEPGPTPTALANATTTTTQESVSSFHEWREAPGVNLTYVLSLREDGVWIPSSAGGNASQITGTLVPVGDASRVAFPGFSFPGIEARMQPSGATFGTLPNGDPATVTLVFALPETIGDSVVCVFYNETASAWKTLPSAGTSLQRVAGEKTVLYCETTHFTNIAAAIEDATTTLAGTTPAPTPVPTSGEFSPIAAWFLIGTALAITVGGMILWWKHIRVLRDKINEEYKRHQNNHKGAKSLFPAQPSAEEATAFLLSPAKRQWR